MLLVVYNFKGGEGKSRIAQNLALTMDYSIITNDVFSPIEKILKNHQFLKIWPDQEFPDVNVDDDIIFDSGGYPDGRVVQILKKSRFIIVPITNEIDNIQVGINTIDTIEKYNKNIIMKIQGLSRTKPINFLPKFHLGFYNQKSFLACYLKSQQHYQDIFV